MHTHTPICIIKSIISCNLNLFHSKMNTPLSHEKATARFNQLKRSPIQYTFNVRFQKGDNYAGVVEAKFEVAHVETDLFLDFTGKQITGVWINGTAVQKIEHDGSFLTLPRTLLKLDANELAVSFKNVYNNDGNGCVSFTDVDGKQYLYTQFEPYYANRVFPLFDQPDLKGTMTLNVIAPAIWKVLSNEKPSAKSAFTLEAWAAGVTTSKPDLVKQIAEGAGEEDAIVLHPATKILPNYLFCIVAGEYVELECPNPYKGLPMSLYCIDSLIEHLKNLAPFVWEVTIESMKFFQSFFGFPFSFNKYEQIFAHEYKWGAMENAGIVTFNDLYVWKEKVSNERMLSLANTISHELAHHWFGNLVTMKWWDDLWLNESFADFISHFCLEKIKNNITTLKYDSSMTAFNNRKSWGYHEDQLITTHPISGPIANTQVAESIFDGITYSKGAATMKQLTFVMGEDNFSKALSEYFHKFAWTNTILPDFIAAMQNHFHSDVFTLEQWKQAWLEKACLNELEPHWDCSCKAVDSKLVIKQTPVQEQHPTLRMHKIQIGFFHEDCSVDVVDAWINPLQSTTVTFDASKGYKALLLNFNDHTFVKHVLDPVSADFFALNLWKIQDLLSRGLIWNSFFTMVKDGKATSQKFIEVFVNNLEREAYDGIFERQFDLVSSAINVYTPHKYRAELNNKIFHFILELIQRTPEEQANRLVILKNKLVESAVTPQTKKAIIQWRANAYEPLKNHKMTIGQQWTAVVRAFTLTDLSIEQKEQLFADQLKIDSSDTSKAKRLTCDSLKADKEQWVAIYNTMKDKTGGLSASLRRSQAAGWNHWHHHEWVKEWRTHYFEDVIHVAANFDDDYAVAFLENLEPIGDEIAENAGLYEALIPRLEKHDRVQIEAKKILDNLKRRLRAYALFEQTKAKL